MSPDPLAELDNGYLAIIGGLIAKSVTRYALITRTDFVDELDKDFGVERITDPFRSARVMLKLPTEN